MTDATERFKARLSELNEATGRRLDSRAVEREVTRRAELADRQRAEAKPIQKEKPQIGGTTTIVDRYGNRSQFKTGDEPV